MIKEDKVTYPYIPNASPIIRKKMLDYLGLKDDMDIFRSIPDRLLLKSNLNMPEPIRDEYSIRRHIEGILSKNKNTKEYINFLGAGCAQHYVPAVCDEIINRGEFLTCYGAPPWADHGKVQALFEYYSLMAELLEMDVLSNPTFDGAQVVCTTLSMARRMNKRKKALLPKTMHPDYISMAKNYFEAFHPEEALELVFVDFDLVTHQLDLNDLANKLDETVTAVIIENPSYLGHMETQGQKIGEMAKSVGAEFIVLVDPISLGVMEAPVNYGATITCGDFHSLGLHLMCGGAQGGFIATNDNPRYMWQFKDLMFGLCETTVEGELGFCSVMDDRTSYALREKGNEYTGTATNLWAINVAVYLSLMGPKGMQEVGQTIMHNSQYAAKSLSKIPGVNILTKSPFFKEFVVNFDETNKTVKEINARLLEHKIFGGKDISAEQTALGQSALYCVTETITKEDIDRMTLALKSVLA